tara:strand:- start:1055 stop:1588 length:534 start_codon:yes stop_codon:yes gene_type:complete
MMKNSCLFLDRDGVINQDLKYLCDPKKIILIDGIKDLIQTANKKKGWKVIVVTNQSGIARGHYTEDDLHHFMIKLKDILYPAYWDDYYFCPFHPDGVVKKYKKESILRKPNPGMIKKALSDHNIDLESSIIVGDKSSDLEAGFSSGLKRGYILGNNQIEFENKYKFKRIKNLREIVI